jgi:thiol-disulfide isomerase/thioredoxin
LLVQQVAAKYPGVVTFVNENFGASKIAERYGVKGYPAVFVDDVLVAAPRDFGYFGEVEGHGRYAPWQKAESQAKFVADLTRMIDLILAGKKDVVRRERAGTQNSMMPLATLPRLTLTDLSGHTFASDQVSGRIVLIEFWATWCPPCRSTLGWLAGLRHQYGDNVAVIALAVESPEGKVREVAQSLSPDLRWAITDARTAVAFGDITSVPTLFLFDRSGKAARVFYGAPPDLHQQAEKVIDQLMKLNPSP